MRTLVDTFVSGNPKTKGSLTFKSGKYAEENVRGSKEWRRLMADACRRDLVARMGEGWAASASMRPISVRATFRIAPPNRLPGWAAALMAVGRPFAAIWGRAGDIDKLSRNLLDALGSTDKRDANVYADDNQVIQLVVHKIACLGGEPPGVRVTVNELDDEDMTAIHSLIQR